MSWVGIMYSMGQGIAQNDQTAFNWYKKGALLNNKAAQWNLSSMYFHGKGIMADRDMARYWLEQARNEPGEALYVLGGWAKTDKDFYASLHYFEESAYKNYPDALWSLGSIYAYRYKDYEVEQDWLKAYNYYKKAADLGSDCGQQYLGELQIENRSSHDGVPQNNYEAIRWLEKAAMQISVCSDSAMLALANLYNCKDCNVRDKAKAISLYQKLARMKSGYETTVYTEQAQKALQDMGETW